MKKTLTLLTSAMLVIATFVACDSEEYTVETPAVAVTGVTLNQSNATLSIGNTLQLTAIVLPDSATNRNVTWSSNSTVATVNNSGVVTAVSAGTAIITVTTQDGNYIARCTITVSSANVPVTGISLQGTATLFTGNSLRLAITILPENATNKDVVWSSSNASVAEVGWGGFVFGISQGTTTITATTVCGNFTDTVALTVGTFGCNSNTPGWGSGLEHVIFTNQGHNVVISGNGVTQTWSGAVAALNCQKTTFWGGSAGNFNADCRSNPNFPGDLFSWCAVMRFADVLCPPEQGWRVPTMQDFIDLDIAMGGSGNNRSSGSSDIATPAFVTENYITRWGGAFGGVSISGGTLNDPGGWGSYWSSTELDATSAGRLFFFTDGYVNPQGWSSKGFGLSLRCVRSD